jgi:hypothetical protein
MARRSLLPYANRIFDDFLISEALHTITLIFKIFLLIRIHVFARLLVMLGPIDFDHQSRFFAHEIDLVSPSVQITGEPGIC